MPLQEFYNRPPEAIVSISDSIVHDWNSEANSVLGLTPPFTPPMIEQAKDLIDGVPHVLEQLLKAQTLPGITREQRAELKDAGERFASLVESRLRKLQKIVDESASVAPHETPREKIQELIDRAVDRGKTILNSHENALEHTFKPINELFDSLKDKLTPDERKEIETNILLFEYRHTKASLNHYLEENEATGSGGHFYFTEEYTKMFAGWGLGHLEYVIKQLEKVNHDVRVDTGIDADLKRFEDELAMRRIFIHVAQSIESTIFGTTKSTEQAGRTFPLQTPAIFVSQDQIVDFINKTFSISFDSRIHFEGEHPYNEKLPVRQTTIPDFDDPTKDSRNLSDRVVVDIEPTKHGEIMRYLDELYADTLKDSYKKAHERRYNLSLGLAADARVNHADPAIKTSAAYQAVFTPAVLSHYGDLSGFYKEMHVADKRDGMFELLSKVMEEMGVLSVTPLEVRQTWYAHVLLINQSMLNKGESPKMDDKMYKAAFWLNYLQQGSTGGTTAAELTETLALFRRYDSRQPDGINYLFEKFRQVERKDMPKPKDLAEKLAYWLSPVEYADNAPAQSKREVMKERLSHEGLLDEFEFLADLPLVVIPPDNKGRFPVFPMPLQYMKFFETDASGAVVEESDVDRNGRPVTRKKMKRWFSGSVAGMSGSAVTAADWVDEHERILYELIPWKSLISDTSLPSWYNNGKNEQKLYENVSSPPSDKLLDPEMAPSQQNDTKYGASVFPVLGQEVISKQYDGEAVFRRISIVSVFARAITLVNKEKSELKDVVARLSPLATVFDPKTIEAITICLNVLFGTRESSQETTELLSAQVTDFFKVR